MTVNSLGNQSTSTSFTITTPSTTDSISSTTQHTSNSANSTAASVLSVAGTSAGDAYTSFSIGTTTQYSIGIDNSDSDNFKITYDTASTPTPSTASPRMVFTTSGNVLSPLNPAFMAYMDATINNLTGDGTNYTVIPSIEVFDVGGNFTLASGIFTAPVTGIYFFGYNCMMNNMNSSHINFMKIVSSAYTITSNSYKWYTTSSGGSAMTNMEAYTSMTAGDTCYFLATAYGSTKTVGLIGGADAPTCVYGYLKS